VLDVEDTPVKAGDNLKDDVALRIETVINSPDDLGCRRMLANLPERSTTGCCTLKSPARARYL
jgi:hypothetical protein